MFSTVSDAWVGRGVDLTFGPLCYKRMLTRRMWERQRVAARKRESPILSAGREAMVSQWCGLVRPEVRAHILGL